MCSCSCMCCYVCHVISAPEMSCSCEWRGEGVKMDVVMGDMTYPHTQSSTHTSMITHAQHTCTKTSTIHTRTNTSIIHTCPNTSTIHTPHQHHHITDKAQQSSRNRPSFGHLASVHRRSQDPPHTPALGGSCGEPCASR